MANDIYSFSSTVAEVLDRLGGRNSARDFDRATRWVNSAQQTMAFSELELISLETRSTLHLIEDQSEYTLTNFPDGFEDLLGIRSIRNSTDSWRMKRFPWLDYRTISTQSEGRPSAWARHGVLLAVDPKPDAACTILVDWRRKPRPGIIEVGSQWQEVLVGLGAYYGAQALGESALAKNFFSTLPATIQLRTQVPMNEAEWEAMWDDELGLVPQSGFTVP